MKRFEFRLQASVEAKMRELFARCPTLHGFSVQDRAMLPRELDQARIPDADLFVTEIGVFPKLESQFEDIYDQITHVISDLVHAQPRAYELLRGRTFARSLQ